MKGSIGVSSFHPDVIRTISFGKSLSAVNIMSLVSFLVLLLIAAICGGIGQALAGYSLGGCFAAIVIGFVGAFLGMWIANALHFPAFLVIDVGGKDFPIIWSIIGSALLALTFGWISRGRGRRTWM